jgi:hypothetical protein
MSERWLHRDHLGVRLGADEARIAVAGVAPDAAARVRAPLVEHDPERRVERPEPLGCEIFRQRLQPRLVAHRGVRERAARPRLRRILAALPVHLVQGLCLRVVRLEVLVADGPRRRETAMMPALAEVLAAQPEERRAEELRVAADRVVRVWVEVLAVPVLPDVLRLVTTLQVHRLRAPVLLLAPHVLAALESRMRLPEGARRCARVPPPAPVPMTMTS